MRPKQNSRILLVDDDQAIRRSTRLILENEGYECREADGGVEALALLDGGLHVDVIVTDLHMPAINGLDLMKALSYRVNGQGIRVILISGNLNGEIERQVLESGAFAVFDKPLDYPRFLRTLAFALEPDS